MCVCLFEREREREREREGERERERARKRKREREKERQRKGGREIESRITRMCLGCPLPSHTMRRAARWEFIPRA